MREPNRDTSTGPESPSRPLLRTALGTVLRRIRQHQGRTLANVAGAAGVSMPYLSELERGRKEASSEVLAAICEALGIDLVELLAAAGRHLVAERSRPAAVVSIGVLAGGRQRQAPQRDNRPRAIGTGDVRCALAA